MGVFGPHPHHPPVPSARTDHSRSHRKAAVRCRRWQLFPCGPAAQNFIESRADPSTPRWIPEKSAEFRNKALRELILYHLITQLATSVRMSLLDVHSIH
ncbi:hypothetical protein DFH06DRAFT_1010806 [Mycena polygramma]|nr:hypothetical protein DFH06DRAFT_1010806 [Mycena polygramma]